MNNEPSDWYAAQTLSGATDALLFESTVTVDFGDGPERLLHTPSLITQLAAQVRAMTGCLDAPVEGDMV